MCLKFYYSKVITIFEGVFFIVMMRLSSTSSGQSECLIILNFIIFGHKPDTAVTTDSGYLINPFHREFFFSSFFSGHSLR